MAKLHISSLAERDVLELWMYIAKDSVAAADRTVRRLNKTFELLAQSPHLGQLHVRQSREFRRIAAPPYVVIFKHEFEELTIMRVLHASRRWEDLL